jgi:hypothetical protein
MSTGCSRLTPTANDSARVRRPAVSRPTLVQVSGRPRPTYGTFHRPVNPAAPASRNAGRGAPMKLGCGQVDVSCTVVSPPAGRTFISRVPFTSSSSAKGIEAVAAMVESPPAGAWSPDANKPAVSSPGVNPTSAPFHLITIRLAMPLGSVTPMLIVASSHTGCAGPGRIALKSGRANRPVTERWALYTTTSNRPR